MFKSARWKADKNKITALFRLRFHASQVSHLGGNALVLSLVPADTGRPTAKLDKFEIRDGCCYWENPILETVKLIQDHKTGKIQERIIYFIISTGSSKLSILGEVSVNIADYAEATEAASVSLPFKGSNSDVILHVLIQRIKENVSQRELEEPEGAKAKPEEDWSLMRHFSNGDAEEIMNINAANEQSLRKTISNTAGLNRNRRRASMGSDITLSSSDSSSGLNTPREHGIKNVILLDSVSHNNEGQSGWELALIPARDTSTDDSTNSPTNVFPNGRIQLTEENSIVKLKSDLVVLSRKAEVADLELQTLRKQIVKESKRGQDLLKEVTSLKEERDALKEECEKLIASQKSKDELKARNKLNYEGDPWAQLEETRQELNYQKDFNVNLQLQLQKTQESNSELILAVQDLEQMLEQCKSGNFDQSAQPVYNKAPEVLEEKGINEGQGQSDDDEEQKALEEIVRQHTDAKDLYILDQKIMDLSSEIEMYRRDKDELEMQLEQLALDYEILKQENHDMSYKLNQSHKQEQLKLQYECSSSYAIINELENRVQKLERELKEQSNELSVSLAKTTELENHIHSLEDELETQAQVYKGKIEVITRAKAEKEQDTVRAEEAFRLGKVEMQNRIKKLEDMHSKEYSDTLSTIRELEYEIQILEEELEKQAQGFESDLEAVTRSKVEQEQRAIRAEEALRLTRWKNAKTAESVQDEFRRLSMQMQSTFEANGKLATKATAEASELRLISKHLEDLLLEAKKDLQSVKADYEVELHDLHNKLSLKSKQIDELLLDIEEKSNQLNQQRKHEEEICQSLSSGSIEDALHSAKKDAEKSLEEVNARCLNNEKDISLSSLQSEVDILRAHCEELRHSLHVDELEKEKLRNQVIQLEDELKIKGEALTTTERELKDSNLREANNLKQHIELLEVQIKQKETALETSENAFLEKEKDLHNKIEDLEKRLDECLKVDGNSDEFMTNGSETIINKSDSVEYELCGLLKEMLFLKEKNSSMESELKEMQERYSAISVRFAEVEGERQKLMMTVRSIKNAKKR